MAWAVPFASLLRAGVADLRDERTEALSLLAEAMEAFSLADIELYAAATRRRLGETLGSERGAELVAEADEWMLGQRIKNPLAMTRMLAPGFD